MTTDVALQGGLSIQKHSNVHILRHNHHKNAGIRSHTEAPCRDSENRDSEGRETHTGTLPETEISKARDSEVRDSEDRDSESRDSEAGDSENGQIQGPLNSDTPWAPSELRNNPKG